MSFDFVGNGAPNIYGQQGYQAYSFPNTPVPQFNSNVQYMQQMPAQPPQPVRPKVNITMDTGPDSYTPDFTTPVTEIKADPVVEEKIKKEPRKKKEVVGKPGEIIRAESKPLSGTVEDVPTAYTYAETTSMLRETLAQIDAISGELVQEFANVRASRTMKNKYMALTNISDNLGSLLSSKISAIREINNSISKSNDLDYKKYKDIKAAQGAMDDDKYIADLYKAFITNPNAQISQPQMPKINDSSVMGSGIIRANVDNNGAFLGGDQAYMNYMSNLTPEQNLMRYENDPDVKQVVVYDQSNGNRFFQMMNMRTGQVIPNVPVFDIDVVDDITIDLNKGVAKSLNINQTFPLVVINQDPVANQY